MKCFVILHTTLKLQAYPRTIHSRIGPLSPMTFTTTTHTNVALHSFYHQGMDKWNICGMWSFFDHKRWQWDLNSVRVQISYMWTNKHNKSDITRLDKIWLQIQTQNGKICPKTHLRSFSHESFQKVWLCWVKFRCFWANLWKNIGPMDEPAKNAGYVLIRESEIVCLFRLAVTRIYQSGHHSSCTSNFLVWWTSSSSTHSLSGRSYICIDSK